ncbi:hypothetical protein Y032_0106g3728 [Ancylostoma ceylanicum]|uniref:Uncharacterized protein n=1 Tax=Ancylostoma ceylanicum TaxID=53326 RepID=A0A016TFR9_9BILA|nr:hypothetical protein Y032_0106g3728 [Ancylostoma ceylanicum]
MPLTSFPFTFVVHIIYIFRPVQYSSPTPADDTVVIGKFDGPTKLVSETPIYSSDANAVLTATALPRPKNHEVLPHPSAPYYPHRVSINLYVIHLPRFYFLTSLIIGVFCLVVVLIMSPFVTDKR